MKQTALALDFTGMRPPSAKPLNYDDFW